MRFHYICRDKHIDLFPKTFAVEKIVSCKGALCNGKKKNCSWDYIGSIAGLCGVFDLGEHDIMLALAVTAGFIALEQDKRKER